MSARLHAHTWWKMPQEQPNARPRAHLIANTRSGKGVGASIPELARRIADDVGIELLHYDTSDPARFEAQIAAAANAAKADGGTLIGAGGDGTLRSVAEKAAEVGCVFGAVACGTFNFFARTHRLPEDPEAALRLAMTGEVRPVRLGRVNGRSFLINASLGLYARAIRRRETDTKRFGRDRLVVILSTIRSMLSLHRNLFVELETETGLKRQLSTVSIFVGNNALQLRDLDMDVARFFKHDLLAVVVLKPVSRWQMLRIILRGLAKRLEADERLETMNVQSLTVKLPHRHISVALDGEMFRMTSPLMIEAIPRALLLRLPERP